MVRCRNSTEALRIFEHGKIDWGDQFRKPHRTEIDWTITPKKYYQTRNSQGNVFQPLATECDQLATESFKVAPRRRFSPQKLRHLVAQPPPPSQSLLRRTN